MTVLLYAIGLIIGITIFLYLLSTYETGKEKFKNYIEKKENPDSVKTEISSNDITYANPNPKLSAKRTCPLCRTPLQDYEALYATESQNEGRKKILIHGCRYCYKKSEVEIPEVEIPGVEE